MATLGSTAEPTSGQEWFGLNTTNQFAVKLTMPAGGPWEVTRLGAWLAGKDMTCTFKLCIWNSSMSLIGESASINAASRSFALGQNDKYEGDLVTPVEVNGGADVWVGFSRDDDESVQFGTRSGTRRQNRDESWPGSLSGYSSVSAAIGAWIENYQSANVAPNAPTNLSPTGSEVVNEGTSPTLSGTRSDPDSGDYISAYEIEVYEDDGTTKVYDSGKISFAGTSHTTFAKAVSLPSAHAFYKWKARTWDKEDVAGPFTSLQRFYANAVPATPAAPTVSSTSTLTPTFTGSFSDPGDSMTHVQLEVQESDGSPTLWSSGDLADTGSTYSQLYAGSALAWNTSYRVRVRQKDANGAYSAWSAWKTWSTTQPLGPDNMSPTSEDPRQSSLTPNLTIGHSAQFRNDQIEVRTSPGGGTLMWSKAKDGADYANTTSKVRAYAGTALSYGQTYYWRALVELSTGVDTSWSDWYPFRINATPNAPTGMSPTGGQVTSDTTPQLTAFFSDPDTDQGDTPSLVDVEVRDNADDSLDWSQTGATPSGSDRHVVSTGALVNEKTYKWRARFTDAMGRQGAWSGYQLFKVSQPPLGTLVAPADAGTVTESTPTLDWSFSSPGGKAQYAYRIRIYDQGPVGAHYTDEVEAWDSGTVVSTDTQRDVPLGVLVDGHDYRWELTVTDTDMLTHVLP